MASGLWKGNPLKKISAVGRAFLFEYQTPRVVTMRSRRIGLIYRIVQLALLVYLIGYVFVFSKSYQRFDAIDSSVVTKVKGVLRRTMNTGESEIWDSSDFVVPAQESDAFFVATNLLYTYNQTQGLCPEDRNVGKNGIHCIQDTDCMPVDSPTPYGNGLKTGRCVQRTGTCEITGWCPTEIDVAPVGPVLRGYDSITVLVKNHIAFRKFGVKRRNILDSFSQSYLQTCRFHPSADPLCPIFALRDMVKFAGEDLDVMAIKGGIIGFNIEWNCNLDRELEECLPEYSFKRLDNTHDKVAKGWNFRDTFYHYDTNGKSRRDLIKFWGIRFVFLVSGRAGKFSIVHFLMHVGSSIGLFGVASVICELILNYWSKSDLLNDSKFVNLEVLKAKRRSSVTSPPVTSSYHNSTSNVSCRSPSAVRTNIFLNPDRQPSSAQPGSTVVTPIQSRKEMVNLASFESISCDLVNFENTQSEWL